MNLINNIIDFLDLKSRWKMFLVSLIAGFLMVALPHIGIRPKFTFSNLIRPQTVKVDKLASIRPQLAQIVNSYTLKRNSFKKELSAVVPASLAAPDYESANAYIVVDFDSGEVIAEKNLSKRLPVASLTKLMSAVVALDLATTDESFSVSKAAAETPPTKMGVIEGQSWPLESLLNSLLLTSANDSAQVIKEGINQKYGDDIFVTAMNAKAQILRLKNTHFSNPQGFDDETHYSSAEDLAILTGYALNNYPFIAETVAKDYQFYPQTQTHKQADLYNWNGLMDVYPGTMGVKIGNTENARYTTIVLSKRGDKKIMVVLLGAPGILQRDLWASELLDLGFKKASNLEPIALTEDQLKAKYQTWKYFN